MPQPAWALTQESIAKYYEDRTYRWKSCRGGIYFGAAGEAVAYCGDKKDSVGIGTWTTNRGNLCYTMTWHFVNEGILDKAEDPEKCVFQIVIDNDKHLWHSWDGEDDYWPGLPKASFFAKGFKFKNKVDRARARLGV